MRNCAGLYFERRENLRRGDPPYVEVEPAYGVSHTAKRHGFMEGNVSAHLERPRAIEIESSADHTLINGIKE